MGLLLGNAGQDEVGEVAHTFILASRLNDLVHGWLDGLLVPGQRRGTVVVSRSLARAAAIVDRRVTGLSQAALVELVAELGTALADLSGRTAGRSAAPAGRSERALGTGWYSSTGCWQTEAHARL